MNARHLYPIVSKVRLMYSVAQTTAWVTNTDDLEPSKTNLNTKIEAKLNGEPHTCQKY